MKLSLCAVWALALCAEAVTQPKLTCAKQYKIKRSDTVSSITHTNHITKHNIYVWNPFLKTDASNLHDYATICLSPPHGTSSSTTKSMVAQKTTTTKASSTLTTPSATPTVNRSQYKPDVPAVKNVCRSYRENFHNTKIIEASDWYPAGTDVDILNLSGTPKAYKVAHGLLSMRFLKPKYDAIGKQLEPALASTLSFAFLMQYGNVTVRMKANPVDGTATALNSMSASADEIDDEGRAAGGADQYPWLPNGGGVATGYHTYRFEWAWNYLSWYVDGQLVRTVYKSDNKQANGDYFWPVDPSQIQFGIWDGGFANYYWAGGPIKSTTWGNATYLETLIDWIQIDCDPEYNTVIPIRPGNLNAVSKASIGGEHASDIQAAARFVGKQMQHANVPKHASPGKARKARKGRQ
ncbi:hypothetical protein BZG36_00554 [Bifiguratus adelaidae]|uniref:GH16 domain-containing protein n=1 Tax=Bifiguratus adelaidae TaxID=1938954 RepID=A0A261Y7A4_9FUNG|nr:hypothetical protein BZG36_00554 [Bifiguratus adelaidae]